jgi:hypothetical protein
MAEQLFCKQQVVGSIPTFSSIKSVPGYQSGQLELTVNQLA